MRRIPLEPAAEEVCNQASIPPLIFQLPPSRGRRVLEDIQCSYVCMMPADVKCIKTDTGEWGEILLYCVTPKDCEKIENIIFYIHGAGWVFGSFKTHEKLVRELAVRTRSLVVFPEYTRSPEVKFPVAIEQCYAALCSLNCLLSEKYTCIRWDKLTVAGDSVGGNMAIAMSILVKCRKGPVIDKQLLYYPVTNACFNTESYKCFARDYYLYREGMMWFWNQYTMCEADRNQIIASPLRASVEQLCGLPDTMIINGEADVLRDEGEAFAQKLRLACVNVTAIRIQAIIHDFVMLNALDQTMACRAAMDVSVEWINRKNRIQPGKCAK